jgi:hypothetical protein
MSYFLLIYDRATGDLKVQEFGGSREDALRARFAEESSGLSSETEVVVLSADSRDDLERTHSRYFHGVAELARTGAKKKILAPPA